MRECSLCILLIDASGSMFFAPAFKNLCLPSQYGNKFCNKAEITCKTVAKSIFELQSMTNSENAYICAIKFDHRQALMFNDNIKNIIAKHQTAEVFARYIYDQLEEMKGGTDITSALTVARSYIEKFMNSDIPEIGDFVPALTPIGKVYGIEDIQSVRAVIYSGGVQDGEYSSIHSLLPHRFIDCVIGIYFGEILDHGCNDLGKILSDCPIHGKKQLFVMDKPKRLAKFKNLTRIAIVAGGFCTECLS